MKLIVAFIQPEKLAAVQAALNKRDVYLMTVSEVLDCGRQEGSPEIYRGREFRRPVSQFRLEVAVKDSSLDAAVAAIAQAGCTGDREQAVDRKIFVMGLHECVQPEERSSVALSS